MLGKYFRYAFFGDPLTTELIEKKTIANLATPDQILAARIIDSFARDFRDWKLKGEFGKATYKHIAEIRDNEPILTNNKLRLVIEYERSSERDCEWGGYISHVTPKCKINGVAIAPAEAKLIADKYKMLKDKVAEAEKVAAEALARQKEENAKWNLVESVFKIKRDGFGRITFDQHEEGPAVCDCGYGIEPTRRKRNEQNCASCSRKSKAEIKKQQAGKERE